MIGTGHNQFPVTLSFFSPVGIVYTSRAGASWQFITAGVIASFMAIFGAVDLTLDLFGSGGRALFVMLAGLLALLFVLFIRSRATEISILDPKRQIVGVPDQPHSLGYSEVDRIFIDSQEGLWRIFMALKDGRQIMLAHGLPLNIARKAALQTAGMVNVPLLGDQGQSVKRPVNLDWSLPYRMPSGRFPLEYLLLAAALAATVCMVAGINIGSIFHVEMAPKWMFLLAIAFPGGQLLADVDENRGFSSAVAVLSVFMVMIYIITLLGFCEPASFFLALIPAAVALLLLFIAYTERRRMLPWILLAIVCVLPGFWIALFASYQHHRFFRLDPAVVESVQVEKNDGHTVIFESPPEIRAMLRALHRAGIKTELLEPQSASLMLTINRPAGRNYYCALHREGSGSNTIAAYRLYCNLWGMKFPLGLMGSAVADKALLAANSTQAIWPPGY